jgi:hypothetical protein
MGLVDVFDVARVIVIVGAIALYLAMTAGRLDRMHIGVDAARASLELQMATRAETIAEVLAEGHVDPVSHQLLSTALTRRRAFDFQTCAAESELSALLRELVDAYEGIVAEAELQQDLRSACNRVEFAYRFYNDAVEQTIQMRMRPVVKYLGLAGHTALPQRIACDVRAPELLDPA